MQGSVISPSSRKRRAFFSPSPSMSIAPLKCLTSWKVWPGQPRRLGQIVHTESSGFTVGVSHMGHSRRRLRLPQPPSLAALDQGRDHLRDHVSRPLLHLKSDSAVQGERVDRVRY